VDELTRLGNRRAFDEVITVESARASRHGVPLSGGGDELAVVMPGTELDAARQVLARLAETVAETCEAPDGRSIGLTWGVARLGSGDSAEDMLAAADLALLERKTEKRR
jgi:PleD family two-component response regulator